MQHTRRILTQAQRRQRFIRIRRAAGVAVLIAAGLGVALVIVAAALAWVMRAWVLPALFGACVLAGVAWAWRSGNSDAQVASLLDHRLGLKDRLGSALHASQHPDHPFAAGVMAEAERAATTARVRDALPLRGAGAGVERWAAAALAVLALVVVFLPSSFDPFGYRQQQQRTQQEQQAAAAAEAEIEEAVALIEPDLADPDDGSAEGDDPADLMDRLESVLSKRDLRDPDQRRDAEAELSKLRDELAEQAEAQRAQDQSMRAALSGLETQERGPADRFVEALRRGDYETARRELQKMADRADAGDLSETEKQKLQEQLDQIAEQLEKQGEQHKDRADQAKEDLQQQLEDAGMSPEDAEQTAEQNSEPGTSSQQAQRQMQDAGASPEQAQQLSQQTQQARQDAQQNQSNGQASQNLSQAVQQMSDALQQGQPCSSPAQQAQQQLGQLSQQQQQVQRSQQAQQQLDQAQQQLAQGGNPNGSTGGQPGQSGTPAAGGGSNSNTNGPGSPDGPGGIGGIAGGGGDGGNPLGATRTDPGLGSVEVFDTQEGTGGRVLTSWQRGGEPAVGDPQVEYRTAVTEGRADAERAVHDDRAPRRYHRAISRYFDRLPATPEGDGRE